MKDITTILEEQIKRIIPSTNASNNIEHYKCNICRDTKWIEIDPETRTFKKCTCQLAREAEEMMQKSGLSEAMNDQTFDKFVVKTDMQKKLYTLGKSYLDALLNLEGERKKPWLYLGGCPGCGKTHIGMAICVELLKRNIPVRYMLWPMASGDLKRYINKEEYGTILAKYVNVKVLYIDDLFKQTYTKYPVFSDADIKLAFSILNERYIQNLPTIISSEWDLLSHLLPADEGTFSRVYERCKNYKITVERTLKNNYRLAEETDNGTGK